MRGNPCNLCDCSSTHSYYCMEGCSETFEKEESGNKQKAQKRS